MKLIDLLVQELPKRGGWPEVCMIIIKNGDEDYLRFRFKDRDLNCAPGITCSGDGVVTRDEYEAAIAASKQVEWDGEGLPPVGTVCEWQDTNTKCWQKVTVVYASEWVTVIREDKEVDPAELAIENYGSERSKEFRPIRTEAERRREDASKIIDDIFYTECKDGNYLRGMGIYDAIAAGKIPGVKLAE